MRYRFHHPFRLENGATGLDVSVTGGVYGVSLCASFINVVLDEASL